MDGFAALLLAWLLPARGFNLDVTHPRVFDMQRDNFGTEVSLRNLSGVHYSLLVAAGKMRDVQNGRLRVEKDWFHCHIEGNCTCEYDGNVSQGGEKSWEVKLQQRFRKVGSNHEWTTTFNADAPVNVTSGILNTVSPPNNKRLFIFDPQDTGFCKLHVYGHTPGEDEMYSLCIVSTRSSCDDLWCVVDLNNDGSDDLVVGDPMYSSTYEREEGRVHVLVSKKESFDSYIIMGNKTLRGHFGSSVSCIGDLSLDGFPDIAVGAPDDSDGGAIYIYRGSEAGVDVQYSQRISAADVDIEKEGIKGFGVSISKGVDIDRNKYNDVAVGASESGHAVLLRARPVVHITASFVADFFEIIDTTSGFSIKYNISFYARHDQPNIDVEVWTPAHPLLCAAGTDDACEEGARDNLYNATKTLFQNVPVQDVIKLALKREVNIPPGPIEVKLYYRLTTDHCQSWELADFFRKCPVVDPKDPTEELININHTLSCVGDLCHTTLQPYPEFDSTMTGKVHLMTSTPAASQGRDSSNASWIYAVGAIVMVTFLIVAGICFAKHRRLTSWNSKVIYKRELEEEKLLEPFKYILQVPGKQIRAKLAHAFNYWLKIPADKLVAVGDIIQMLHNASLLGGKNLYLESQSRQTDSASRVVGTARRNIHSLKPSVPLIDDIEDNSVLRRGVPVAHSIYGVASTINAANYVIFLAMEKAFALGHSEATRVCTEQLLELHRGQGMEIYWRDNYICPSEEEYKMMTKRKTGGLFMLAIRLMQLFSSNQNDLTHLTGILGLYFQIRDDYCNLCLQEYAENKSFCEDLTEGKFSFPIIHAILSRQNDNQVINILRQRTRDIDLKKYCISLLERFGSFAYTRNTLQELDAEARVEIARLGGNPLLVEILDTLLNWRSSAE